jgi:AP-1 complex subunit gamma-1
LAFAIPQRAQSPPRSAAPPTATARFPSYTAYDKNELKITLTPQTSAAKPGIVLILARFQVTGSNEATSLNFQAAVPKVSSSSHHLQYASNDF